MKMIGIEHAVHLGDGAYMHYNGHQFVMTANHHDPRRATDTVHLDPSAIDDINRFNKAVAESLNERES